MSGARLRRWLIVAPLVAVAAGAAGTRRTTVTVLFTSDLHARVLPFDLVRQRPTGGSLAQVADYVDEVRAANPATIVLDGGDAIEGSVLAYYAIAADGAPGRDPSIAAMNLVGYDAAVVGNHEFNFGLDVLRRSLSQARFPWLAGNLSGAAEVALPVGDELVIERGGVKVGVLGLTNPNVPHWDPPSHWPGLAFGDPVTAAATRVAELRRSADLVVIVSHGGFERDPESGAERGGEAENHGWRLAHLPGIDLLLTGHTHRDIPPRLLAGTIVAQPGSHAELVTRVDIELERRDGAWVRVGWSGENVVMKGRRPAARVVAAAEEARRRATTALGREIGTLTAPLVSGVVAAGDDPALDLIHAVQLAASGAQLSLAAPLSHRRAELPAGPITVRFAHALYAYANTLVVVRLSGRQLAEVLEHAVSGWVGVECDAGSTCTALRDRRRPPYTFDTVEGATYLVDPSAPVGRRIRGLRVAGRPVAESDSFTLVVNSYRAAGGGDYPHLATAERVAEIDRQMVELIVDYVTETETITPVKTDNWAMVLNLRSGLAGGARVGVQ